MLFGRKSCGGHSQVDSVVVLYVSPQRLGERARIWKKVEMVFDVVGPSLSSLGCRVLVHLAQER